MKNHQTNQATRNIAYLFAGGAIGAAVALLFAPKSGSELRHDIADVTRKGYDDTLELAREIKEQSSTLYHSLSEKTGELYGLATDKLFAAKERVGDAVEAGKEKIEDEFAQISSSSRRKGNNSNKSVSNVL